MRGYQAIKELSQETGQPIPSLLALARKNDPYFAGSPANVDVATWFGGLWQRAGFGTGVHLRRVHYQLVSTEATKHDGSLYSNTQEAWTYLCEAGKAARYLGLVDPTAFEDRRNPPPVSGAWARWEDPEPGATVYEPTWELPTIKTDIAADVDLSLPKPEISGYDYQDADQPYHLVVFVEKSTMNDVLLPICRQYGIDYITSLGFQSITTVVNLLQRIQALGKPCRIAYISDFDPAGDFMPVGVARQIEFWAQDYCSKEVLLDALALTRGQVDTWRLPTIPIKASDLRAQGFMDRRDCDGAVELDALEALHPGELARIVEEWAEQYRDPGLANNLQAAHDEARAIAEQEWAAQTDDLAEQAAQIQQETIRIVGTYEARLEQLAQNMAWDLEPLQERLDTVRLGVQERIAGFSPVLPDRPEPEASEPDEDDVLFDSNRAYMEQLAVYRARKAGDTA